jgi:hypothetical protein
MNTLPQKYSSQRAIRVRPAEYTPAVLRVEDGSCTQATLELYSLTGGLLSLQKPLDRGARARVLFLTQTGPVLGMAEMLRPVSWKEQPFRFLTMHEEDQRKLKAATQPAAEIAVETSLPPIEHASLPEDPIPLPSLAPSENLPPALEAGEPWIQKYRTAIYETPPPEKRLSGKLVGTLAAAGVGLVAIVYTVQHLLR